MMPLNKANKKIWPGYIPPLKNELFSSWYIRLCYEHKIKSYSFSKFYFEGHPIWNRDIDKLFPEKIVSSIISHTNLNYNQVRNLFLISYQDIVFNTEKFNSHTESILNLGVYHRKRKQYGLLCCPSCLSDTIPYFRKEWRLNFSLACSKCKCYLIDKCPNCNSPIEFHRLETGYKESLLKFPLYICWNCHHDLRINIKKYTSNSTIFKYQEYIDNTINNGYNDITQYSFTYFSVLLHLAKKIQTSSKKWARIKITVEDFFNIRTIANHDKKIYHTIESRTEALLLAFNILQKWPHTFIKIFETSNVRYSDFSKDYKNIPFWFQKVIRDIR